MKETEILTQVQYQSPFKLEVSCLVIGEQVPIKLPPFKFYYYCDATKIDKYEVSYDGDKKFKNCKLSHDGVVAIFENHNLTADQQLKVRREIMIEDPDFTDSNYVEIQEEILPIKLVTTIVAQGDPTMSKPQLKTSSSILPRYLFCDRVLIKQGPKGEMGPKSITDFSKIGTEKEIEGEFWSDNSGAKKKVFSRTFIFNIPLDITTSGIYKYWNTTNIDQSELCAGSNLAGFNPGFISTDNNTPYKCYWTNLGATIYIVQSQFALAIPGKKAKLTLKYSKLNERI